MGSARGENHQGKGKTYSDYELIWFAPSLVGVPPLAKIKLKNFYYRFLRKANSAIVTFAHKIKLRSSNKTKPKNGTPKNPADQCLRDWSYLSDLNRRPHPYQGCALPTELR